MKKKTIGTLYSKCMKWGISPDKLLRLNLSDATTARKVWDYRAVGLKIDDARGLKEEVRSKENARQLRRLSPFQPSIPKVPTPHIDAYKYKLYRRNSNKESLRYITESSLRVEVEDLANWTHRAGRITLSNGNFLLLYRHEYCTWGKKRGQWPTSKTVSYSAKLYSAEYDDLGSVSFQRRGDFLAEVAQKLGLPTTKRNNISLSAATLVVSTRVICGIKVHALETLGCPDGVAVERDGVVVHNPTVSGAISDLRRKLLTPAQLAEKKIITWDYCRSLGFCAVGIGQFMCDMGIPEGTWSIAIQELKNYIAGKDVSLYESELKTLGVI
jgi:hypothetical protein